MGVNTTKFCFHSKLCNDCLDVTLNVTLLMRLSASFDFSIEDRGIKCIVSNEPQTA
jgi:hypothetical protein